MEYFEVETRARKPIKGLRVKLRTALRAAGVKDKFRTDLLRSGVLAVISKAKITLPFEEFEGHKVKLYLS